MLKYSYDTDTDIPDTVKDHYTKGEDGKHYLQAEGVVPKVKLEEFRTNNTALLKERDMLKERFAGVDPDEWKVLKERKDLLDQGKLVGAEGVDAAVKKRTETMAADHGKALTSVEQRAAAAEAKVAEFMIDGELVKAGSEARIRPTATADLLNRGRAVFRLRDGKLEAIGADGNPIYGATGEALTPKEFVASLVKAAPHLFEESGGGGAGGGAGNGGAGNGTDGNPYLTDTWNLTKQDGLRKIDPAKAQRLKAAAQASGKYGPPAKK